MNTKTGVLGDVLEEFEATVGQAAKQIKGAPKQVIKTVAGQTGVPNQNPAAPTGDENNKDIVKALYGKSKPQTTIQNPQTEQPKTPEEVEKLAKARQELLRQHKEIYYDPIFNKKAEEAQEEEIEEQQEEQEEEQKKKMELLQKKEEKDKDLATQKAQHRVERPPGAG